MMAAPISSSVNHRTTKVPNHEQCYLMSELESLGLSTIQLNEFNTNEELRSLLYGIKQSESPSSKHIVTKKCIEQCIELRSLGIRIKTAEHKSDIRGGEKELADIVRIVKYSLYNAYKTLYGRRHKNESNRTIL
jgi:hypothetical protein